MRGRSRWPWLLSALPCGLAGCVTLALAPFTAAVPGGMLEDA